MSTTPEIERWQAAEARRDRLQDQLARLDQPEALLIYTRPEIDAKRERLDQAIADADDECEATELAYWRSEGDDEKVRALEMRPFERSVILADLYGPPDDAEEHQ